MARNFITTRTITATSPTLANQGTIGIWLSPNGTDAQKGIWDFSVNSDNPSLQLYYGDGQIYAGFKTGGNSRITVANGSTYFTQNVWAHWAFTWSVAGGQNLYKNAGAVGTPTSYTAAGYNGSNYLIGACAPGFAMCKLSDYAYWDAVLSAGELSALAAGQRPMFVRPNSLKIWLPIDGIQSPEPDLGGSAYNGTLSATPPAYAPGPPMTMFTPRWPRNYDVAAATVPLSQTHYRFRTDGDAVDATPTWGADEDTNGYNPDVNKFRIRVKVENP